MRLFVLLALVAFTGCQENEPTPQLDQIKQAFLDYLTNAAQTAEDTLINIKETELGQQVSAKIEESAYVARQYALVLQDQVSVVGQESFDKVAEQVDWLKERLRQDVSEVSAKLESYTEKLKEKVDQCIQEFQQSVTPLAESLQTQLAQKAKMLQQTLAPYVEDLREKLDPYGQNLKSQLTSFWESLAMLPRGLIE